MTSIEEALEGSSPLARKVGAGGPYPSPAAMVTAMRRLLPTLTEEEAIATLNAHPRIGDDPRRLSARSRAEQGDGAVSELKRLNAEYEGHFGFRFVVFVNRRPKSEILPVLRERLRHTRGEEMAVGLQAIVEIAEDRLRR